MKPLLQILMSLLILFAACTPGGTEAEGRDTVDTAARKQVSQAAPSGKRQAMSTPAAETAEGSPAMSIPEPNYRFENVVAGQPVIHDFIVQNNGTAVLNITRVRTG
ncbi:MAG: DUF1573 domain-containing protein [Deltaproteobacteria bacterium]|nr:DUF1573 domain-containing protein [Deltaproteobacteria bacterium]